MRVPTHGRFPHPFMSAVGGVSLPHTSIDPGELRMTRLRALRGPNYWRLAPVIACDVQCGALESLSSADVPGFTDRLVAAIPTLREHPCTRGREGGFIDRLQEGTHLPHILEHVALELQTLAGCDVSFGRVVESGDPGTWWVIVAYDEEEVGLQSMRDAVTIVRALLAGEPIDVGAIVDELQELYEAVRLGPSTAPSSVVTTSPFGTGRPMFESTRLVSSLSCAISTPMALV